jgi:hypothetical protein
VNTVNHRISISRANNHCGLDSDDPICLQLEDACVWGLGHAGINNLPERETAVEVIISSSLTF